MTVSKLFYRTESALPLSCPNNRTAPYLQVDYMTRLLTGRPIIVSFSIVVRCYGEGRMRGKRIRQGSTHRSNAQFFAKRLAQLQHESRLPGGGNEPPGAGIGREKWLVFNASIVAAVIASS